MSSATRRDMPIAGMTPRNRALFLERGHAYVYLAYGVSWMLNVSSEAEGIGAGVLIRALEPLEGIAIMQTIGEPSACAISREDRDGLPRRSGSIARSTGSTFAGKARSGCARRRPGSRRGGNRRERRIGITPEADRVLRFYLRGSPFVSGAKSLNE